jgi:NADH:ubiquinone oxidoreductase subunit 3 (subunit A)
MGLLYLAVILVICNRCVTVAPAGGSSESQRESMFPFICNIEHCKKLTLNHVVSLFIYEILFTVFDEGRVHCYKGLVRIRRKNDKKLTEK